MNKFMGKGLVSVILNSVEALNTFYKSNPFKVVDVQMQYNHFHCHMQYLVTFEESVQIKPIGYETKDVPFTDYIEHDDDSKCLECGKDFVTGDVVIGVEEGYCCSNRCFDWYANKRLVAVKTTYRVEAE